MNRKRTRLSLCILGLGLALLLFQRPWTALAQTLVPQFTLAWGLRGSAAGQFDHPTSVIADGADYLLVIDTYNHRLQKFDGNGHFLDQWGVYGLVAGQLNYPSDAAIDQAGNIYVTDTDNHRIQQFSSDGTFLRQWGALGSENGEFYYPRGIAIDSQGDIYVVDQHNHRVQKFDSNGLFLTTWGSYDPADGQRGDEGEFNLPTDVAADSVDNLYVVDHYNHRIQKFDSDGNFIAVWGSQGSGIDQFYFPVSLALDRADNIYVADTGNSRVQKFDSNLAFVAAWGSRGHDDGEFHLPTGVAVDSTGAVYVTDIGDHRVQKFGGILVTKTARPGGVEPGQRVDFSLSVSNRGVEDFSDLLIFDALSGDLTFAGPVALEPDQPGAILATSAFSLPLLAEQVALPAAARLTFTLPVTVNLGLPEKSIIENSSVVSHALFAAPVEGSTFVIVSPDRLYLPLIFKD